MVKRVLKPRTLLSITAKTEITAENKGGLSVMAGVFSVYETHGLPLDAIFAALWERGAVPDWTDLVLSMIRAGRPMARAFGAVRSAVDDACYPPAFRDAVQQRLNLLEARCTGAHEG